MHIIVSGLSVWHLRPRTGNGQHKSFPDLVGIKSKFGLDSSPLQFSQKRRSLAPKRRSLDTKRHPTHENDAGVTGHKGLHIARRNGHPREVKTPKTGRTAMKSTKARRLPLTKRRNGHICGRVAYAHQLAIRRPWHHLHRLSRPCRRLRHRRRLPRVSYAGENAPQNTQRNVPQNDSVAAAKAQKIAPHTNERRNERIRMRAKVLASLAHSDAFVAAFVRGDCLQALVASNRGRSWESSSSCRQSGEPRSLKSKLETDSHSRHLTKQKTQ